MMTAEKISREDLTKYIRRLRVELRDLVNMVEEGGPEDFDWLEETNALLAETAFAEEND